MASTEASGEDSAFSHVLIGYPLPNKIFRVSFFHNVGQAQTFLRKNAELEGRPPDKMVLRELDRSFARWMLKTRSRAVKHWIDRSENDDLYPFHYLFPTTLFDSIQDLLK
jgi:hypothetical protein